MVDFHEALQHGRVTKAVVEGFPLREEMMFERFRSMGKPDVTCFEVALHHEDDTRFTVKFQVDDYAMAQAYEPAELFVSHAREQIKQALVQKRQDRFDELVEAWHFDEHSPTTESFQVFMNFTDEQNEFWETTGDKPEGW